MPAASYNPAQDETNMEGEAAGSNNLLPTGNTGTNFILASDGDSQGQNAAAE